MGVLNFTVGPVSCGKTVELIIKAYQLQRIVGKEHVLILKPEIDTRFSSNIIKSSSGLEIELTRVIKLNENLLDLNLQNVSYIFFDEIQFCTKNQIEQLSEISRTNDIEIYCFGLLNDFRTEMFPSTKRLLELCDNYKQIKTFCSVCKLDKNPIFSGTHSMRVMKDGENIKATISGDTIAIGGIETFLPVCTKCYFKCTKEIAQF